jgi:hypothetical protein
MGSPRRLFTGLAALAVLSIAGQGPDAAGAGDPPANPPRAIVEVETPTLPTGDDSSSMRRWHRLRARSSEVLGAFAARHDLRIENRIPEIGQLSVALDGASPGGLRRRLAGDPRLIRVLPVRTIEYRYTPNDFAFSRADPNAPGGDLYQWNLVRSSGPAAWDLSRGAGAEVAVIDTGADVTHPDLAGRIAGTLNCGATCAAGPVTDPSGHGTHVAGLACADSDNGVGLASLGFDCNLYVVRTGTSCDGAAEAVVHAANRGSDAINMSFGGCGVEFESAIGYAWSRGSVPVAAGDNTPAPSGTYPAAGVQPEGTGPNLDAGRGLVITAAKHNGTRAAFALASTGVSVAAFGAASDMKSGGQQGILSTFPPSGGIPPLTLEGIGGRTTINGSNRYAYLVGTSMATPQVSGIVALMRAAAPSLSAPNLVRLLKASASHCLSYRDGIGWGLVNAQAAVAAAIGRDQQAPSSRVKRAKRNRLKVKRTDQPNACAEELPSSGVRVVKVFASRNGKKFRRLAKTKKRRFVELPKRRGRYRFYSVAVDKDGNREAEPEDPDLKLKVKSLRRPG